MTEPSVIIDYFHVSGTSGSPPEANAKLVIHTNAALPGTVAFQQLQPVAGRHTKIIQFDRDLQLPKLSPCHGLNADEPPDSRTIRKRLGVLVPKGNDHLTL
jgi:hypothetical protein